MVDGEDGKVPGEFGHVPVLLNRADDLLGPAITADNPRGDGAVMIDATLGLGGHSEYFLRSYPGLHLIGLDRDPEALRIASDRLAPYADRTTFVHTRYDGIVEALGQAGLDPVGSVHAILFDLGVSSMQLDEAERGFSFRSDGPLDMRMGRAGTSAADVVNRYKAADLARIFGLLGEERHAGRIARMIEKRRAAKPFERTRDLAEAIEALVGRHPKDKIHPATRVFQALRIHVNDELGELAGALVAAERALKPGGRLAVVTFHSLEDRIVKRFIADRSGHSAGSRHLPETAALVPTFERQGGAVSPSEAEVEANPRARSARLRAAVRTAAAPRAADTSIFGLPKLPDIPHAPAR